MLRDAARSERLQGLRDGLLEGEVMSHVRHLGAALALALALSAGSHAQPPGDDLLGEWWTENNEGRIRITRDKEGFYRGTTTCCVQKDAQGRPIMDVNNPNPERRA